MLKRFDGCNADAVGRLETRGTNLELSGKADMMGPCALGLRHIGNSGPRVTEAGFLGVQTTGSFEAAGCVPADHPQDDCSEPVD